MGVKSHLSQILKNKHGDDMHKTLRATHIAYS